MYLDSLNRIGKGKVGTLEVQFSGNPFETLFTLNCDKKVYGIFIATVSRHKYA